MLIYIISFLLLFPLCHAICSTFFSTVLVLELDEIDAGETLCRLDCCSKLESSQACVLNKFLWYHIFVKYRMLFQGIEL